MKINQLIMHFKNAHMRFIWLLALLLCFINLSYAQQTPVLKFAGLDPSVKIISSYGPVLQAPQVVPVQGWKLIQYVLSFEPKGKIFSAHIMLKPRNFPNSKFSN